MTIAQGIRKQTVFKKQAGLGVPASGAGGQILRRESSTFSLTKGTFESEELITHQQHTGVNFGSDATQGNLQGLISPGTYKAFMQSLLRKDFVAGVNSTALTNVTAATTSGSQGTFTRAAGSWLTDGFKVGDVVRWAGWGAPATANNAKNMMIVALTATVMTVDNIDNSAVVSKASGDSVTATVHGKKTLVPLTGHTDDYHTVEEWYSDLSKSELFSDMKLNSMAIEMPASGNCKVTFALLGIKRTRGGAQVLTAPASETTSPVLQSPTGMVLVNGQRQGVLTGLSLNVEANVTVDGPVVGSKFAADLAQGKIKASGQFTAFFDGVALQDLFDANTALGVYAMLTSDGTAAAEFIKIGLSRVKLTGDAPDDGDKAIVRTYPFTAEIDILGGAAAASDQTIITIQDSLA